ncbi:MAG: eukaryotic translation initiation factor 2-alpha kinase [Marteilia pararefringens]
MEKFNSFISDDHSSKTIFNRARFENQYEVLKDLGRGSFGRVYSAISYVDNQIYAVKEIKTYNDPTVFNEARIFSQLSKIYHPNVVRYYSSWVELKHNWKKGNSNHYYLDNGIF